MEYTLTSMHFIFLTSIFYTSFFTQSCIMVFLCGKYRVRTPWQAKGVPMHCVRKSMGLDSAIRHSNSNEIDSLWCLYFVIMPLENVMVNLVYQMNPDWEVILLKLNYNLDVSVWFWTGKVFNRHHQLNQQFDVVIACCEVVS